MFGLRRKRILFGTLAITFLLVTGANGFFGATESPKKKDPVKEVIQNWIKPAFVSAPKDQEVCFSPEESCAVKLVKFIDSAEKSLDIAVYDITLDELVHHVLVKAKKIQVRIVVDRRQAKGNHSLVSTLVKGGADIKFGRQRGIMHNKFVIVDGKAVETGSFNYTNNASKANHENQIYLWNPQVVERYKQEFERLWNEGDPIRKNFKAPRNEP